MEKPWYEEGIFQRLYKSMQKEFMTFKNSKVLWIYIYEEWIRLNSFVRFVQGFSDNTGTTPKTLDW